MFCVLPPCTYRLKYPTDNQTDTPLNEAAANVNVDQPATTQVEN